MSPVDWISIDIESIKTETHTEFSVIEFQFVSSLFGIGYNVDKIDFVFGKNLPKHQKRICSFQIQDADPQRLISSTIEQLVNIRSRALASSTEVEYSIVDHRSFPVFIWTPWNEPLLVQCLIDLTDQRSPCCYVVLSQTLTQSKRVEKFYNHKPVKLLTLPEVLAQIDAKLTDQIHTQARDFVLSSAFGHQDVS